jgi:hypothetical protein
MDSTNSSQSSKRRNDIIFRNENETNVADAARGRMIAISSICGTNSLENYLCFCMIRIEQDEL